MTGFGSRSQVSLLRLLSLSRGKNSRMSEYDGPDER
jgi:hypothetical protein